MIVLDCSAGMEIALGTDEGRALRTLLLPEEEVIAPSLYSIEAVNVAWKLVHRAVMEKNEAKGLIQDALALPDRLVPADDMLVEAFALAVSLDHSVYDMLYLVLARRNDATLMTGDKRLQALCLDAGVSCITDVDVE